ncbi:MAG: hypothetical protein MZV64_13785 [Ignavibacteriales bacterium]|nr:hypothetical protein [Ignavibacteriales bacterium]
MAGNRALSRGRPGSRAGHARRRTALRAGRRAPTAIASSSEYLNLGYRLARVDAAGRRVGRPHRRAGPVRDRRGAAGLRGPRPRGGQRPRRRGDDPARAAARSLGSRWALEAIEESQRRLAALGVFRRVTLSELQHEADDRRDVVVTVEESPATTLGCGGGVEFQDVETIEVAPARVLRNRPPEPLGQEPVDQPVQPRQPPPPHLHGGGADGRGAGGVLDDLSSIA